MLTTIIAAAASAAVQTATAQAPPAAAPAPAAEPVPDAVGLIEVVTRVPVVGTMQEGIQAYRAEHFTSVRPGTAFDMVQWLPGFTFEDTRDVRGLGGAIGNVLIDGQPPTNKNDTLATVLRRIPAHQVDRVDLIVGGAPGIDMRGRTVIANVVLKKTAAPKGALSAAVTIYQDGRIAPDIQANITRKSEERLLEASLSATRRQLSGIGPGTGTLIRFDPFGRVLFDADSVIRGRIWETGASGGYQFPLAGGKLHINGSGRYLDVIGDERAEVVGSTSVYSIVVAEEFRRGELGLRYERPFGRMTLESQALQRFVDREASTATERPPVLTEIESSEKTRESIARSTLRFNRDETLSFEASAEGVYNRLDIESDFLANGQVVKVPAEDVLVRERRGDVGVLAAWKPSKTFTLTGAARVETSTLTASGDVNLERTLTYVKPRVVMAWSPDERTQLRLRGEREVDQIGFYNFVAAVDTGSGQVRAGNPDLRPRRAWVAEAAVERQFWTGASVVVTLRHLRFDDVVDQLLLPEFGDAAAVGNIGDGRQTDIATTLTLPLKRVGLTGMNLKATVTRRWSEVIDPTTGLERRFSGQPRWSGELHFSHDIPTWKIIWGVDAHYADANAVYRPTFTQGVGPFTRVSAFIEYRLKPDLNLRVEGVNLNDPRPLWIVKTFTGPRGSAPLLYTERRRLGDGPLLMVRLRKDLG